MTTTVSSPASPFRRKGILNRITERWWRILLLWVVVSVPVLYVIRVSVEPLYEAFSLLRVQPVSRELYGTAKPETVDYKTVLPYLQTQVALITTDRVLTTALSSPEIKNLGFIAESDDPRVDLRKNLNVGILEDAYLIRVALELANGKEAAAIVNSVVNSYLAYNGEFKRGENSRLRASLSAQRVTIQNEIKRLRDELRAVYRSGTVSVPKNVISLNESGKVTDPTRSTFGSITQELSQQIASEMVKTDLDLIRAQAILETKQTATQDENDMQHRQSLGELKLNFAALLRQKEYLAKYYAQSKVEMKVDNDVTFEVTFLNHQLDTLLKNDEQLKRNLEELDFKASQDDYRVAQVDEAKVPKAPTNNSRLNCMVAAPIVVLLMLLGLCLLTPIKDESPSRSSAKPTPQDEIGR